MLRPKIYYRADGNSTIGLGHVSRCCALAEMLKKYFECIFIIQKPLPDIKKQILQSCSKIITLQLASKFMEEAKKLRNRLSPGDIVVLDGYRFVTAYQREIKKSGCKLVCVDDIYSYHFLSDAIINHAGGVLPSFYSREYFTRLFLGPEYAMLRKPFWENKVVQRKNNSNVLVLLGGADPTNQIQKVLERCYRPKDKHVFHIVVGAAYGYIESIKEFLESRKDFRAKLYRNMSAAGLKKLMQKCETAITSPSTTAFEYLFVGGKLYLHTIADNQKNVFRYFIENKLARSFSEWASESDVEFKGARLEYNFVQNIRKVFFDLRTELSLEIHKATIGNAKVIFNWINDPVVRAQSYNSAMIPWESHFSWYKKKINDKKSFMYLIYLNKKVIGQARFEVREREATISYMLSEAHRGKGLGKIILKMAVMNLIKEARNVRKVIGYVKQNNMASRKSFQHFGFVEKNTNDYPNSMMYVLNL
jgi:UDP-2,4-diacetamido-2,4,6-trideoxy-beta-L-altropyranose hydrolase